MCLRKKPVCQEASPLSLDVRREMRRSRCYRSHVWSEETLALAGPARLAAVSRARTSAAKRYRPRLSPRATPSCFHTIDGYASALFDRFSPETPLGADAERRAGADLISPGFGKETLLFGRSPKRAAARQLLSPLLPCAGFGGGSVLTRRSVRRRVPLHRLRSTPSDQSM